MRGIDKEHVYNIILSVRSGKEVSFSLHSYHTITGFKRGNCSSRQWVRVSRQHIREHQGYYRLLSSS
jgi:hypothetical protein